MSTPIEQPLQQPGTSDPHDDFTGAFGFFRRYQKLILYSAVIFALVTFSITGAMTQFFADLTRGAGGPMPTIEVDGRTVAMEPDDTLIANSIARNLRALPPVLPTIDVGPASSDLATCLAILRRAAIASGLEASMDEVDRAIEWYTAAWNAATKQTNTSVQLARMRGMESLAQYRTLVREAMRIGNYIRLNSIGVDSSDARLIESLLDGQEKITLRYAVFDRKTLEEELKQRGDVTAEMLQEWLAGKDDAEKYRLQVFDTNRVSLVLGVAWFDRFDAAQWPAELEGFELGEEQKKQLYEIEKEVRFKAEAEGEFRPFEDEAVQTEILRLAQVEEVLNKLLAKLRDAYQEAIKTHSEELQTCMQEKFQAQQDRDAAKAEATAKPEDEELQTRLRQAEETLVAKENAETAAKNAMEEARKSFDFRRRFAEATDGKTGFELIDLPGNKNAEELKDLEAIGLGAWKNPYLATALQNAGEISSAPARTPKGAFLFQATEVVVRPLKPWDDIKAPVEEAYFAAKSKEVADEKKKLLEDALLRLGKELIAEQVAEIEARREPRIEERFSKWEATLQERLATAEQRLASLRAGTLAHSEWLGERDRLANELQQRESQRQSIEQAVAKELDDEVKKEARKKYADVLETAAQEAGFTLGTIGPIWRRASSEPWFQKRVEKAVAFLMSSAASSLKVGEVTDVLEDVQNRRFYVASCTAVEPRTAADLTRREFESMRANFGKTQVATAIRQSFDKQALVARYNYKEPVGRMETGGER